MVNMLNVGKALSALLTANVCMYKVCRAQAHKNHGSDHVMAAVVCRCASRQVTRVRMYDAVADNYRNTSQSKLLADDLPKPKNMIHI
jgi:hypothetical protein